MHYRVIPRDLFNEAKLLKSLGRLCLMIHEGQADPLTVEHEDPETGFQVGLCPTRGVLYVSNLWFQCDEGAVEFYTDYNDRGPWPLWAEMGFPDGGADTGPFEVFTDDGELTQEFRAGVLEVATNETN